MKTNFLKKEKSFKKKKLQFNPRLCWMFLVCGVCVVSIFSLFFGYYLFMQIEKEPSMSSNGNVTSTRMVKKERIDKVLEYFKGREEKSNQIIKSPSPIIDPSI